MRVNHFTRSSCRCLLIAILCSAALVPPAGAATNIFSTGFELPDYDSGFSLVGQDGWLGEGSGGNGLLIDKFPGQGQQAYIGAFPPTGSDDYLLTWKPINFDAVAAGFPLVKFSTSISIEDSTNGEWDNFEWILFNSDASRLFSIDFDNFDLDVAYRLDGSNPWVVPSPAVPFVNGVIYTLTVTMDFEANLWSASLNNALIATNQPLTTSGLPLNLGDMDAFWLVYNISAPGDNYMVFDNYTITAMRTRPAVELVNRAANGNVSLRLHGENGWKVAVDASTNLTHWTPLATNTITVGDFVNYVDTSAASLPQRFYRGRLVP